MCLVCSSSAVVVGHSDIRALQHMGGTAVFSRP